MPDSPSRLHARDYSVSAMQAKYGYFASVLRPNMTSDEIRIAISTIQRKAGFVARLNDVEIDYFIDNFEIVGSSADSSDAADVGLEALILRARATKNLLLAFGGVGPFEDVSGALEAIQLSRQSASYGLPIDELNAFIDIAAPILSLYPDDVTDHIFALVPTLTEKSDIKWPACWRLIATFQIFS